MKQSVWWSESENDEQNVCYLIHLEQYQAFSFLRQSLGTLTQVWWNHSSQVVHFTHSADVTAGILQIQCTQICWVLFTLAFAVFRRTFLTGNSVKHTFWKHCNKRPLISSWSNMHSSGWTPYTRDVAKAIAKIIHLAFAFGHPCSSI